MEDTHCGGLRMKAMLSTTYRSNFSEQTTTEAAALDPHGWGFASLILVVGSLFIRPADLLPQLRDVSVYQFLIVTAILFSYRSIGNQLNQHLLGSRPVTACILLLVGVVALSHIGNGFFWGARESAWKVTKLVALYLLVVGVVNTNQRLEIFASWLILAITIMSALALADAMGWMDLTAFSPIEDGAILEGEEEARLTRIRGSGIFEDPNDLGLAIVVGLSLIPYFLLKPDVGWPRYFWLVPGTILIWTLVLTYSRGAFLAFAATIPGWYFYHRGWVFSLVGTLALSPFLLFVFGGRMTEFNSVYDGTGQSRIQIWSESLTAFRNAPFLGIGEGLFSDQFGFVCHNSFLQTYSELGFLGGTLFIGVFATAFAGLISSGTASKQGTDESTDQKRMSDAIRLRGAVFVVLVGYTVGMLSLSRQFLAPTFLVLGLAVAAQQGDGIPVPKEWCVGNKLVIRASTIGVAFLGLCYLAVQILIRGK